MTIQATVVKKQSDKSEKVGEISSAFIIEGYKKVYNIDVASYFTGVATVQIMQCPRLKYCYFAPQHIIGDGALYDELQKISWYYAEWKWEYQIMLEQFGGAGKLLEVGSGKGAFLKRMQATGKQCVGLELSDDAIVAGRENNVSICKRTIEEYAAEHEESYDIVCSFQVLEHIAEVDSFISSSLRALKKGGKFIVAVPNNDVLFLKERNTAFEDYEYQKALLLNLPPHHMSLWNQESLRNLEKAYPICLDNFLFEPLAPWRRELNCSILKNKKPLKPLKFLPNAIVNPFLLRGYKEYFRHGDTIIAIFTKQ